MKVVCSVLFLLTLSTSFAQGYAPDTRYRLGSWLIVNTKVETTGRLNLFAEAQIRGQQTTTDFNYWEAKTFFHYKVGATTWLGLGVGTYHQYKNYENFQTPRVQREFRMWAEGFQKAVNGRVIFEHRYRAEYRIIGKYNTALEEFVMNTGSSNQTDRFRFRYRLQTFVPLNHKDMAPKTVFVNASDEVMFTNLAPYYTQNRLFVGAGYKFNSTTQAMLGLMHQFNRSTTAVTRKDYLQLTVATVFKVKKKESTPVN